MKKLRIISGTKRATLLYSPEGEEIRPTIDRVKEGIFSAIQFELQNKSVLDLFCGTGQLALEALSRGADYAIMCDESAKTCALIKKNIERTNFNKQCELLNVDYRIALSRIKQESIDIVFLDPPYGTNILSDALNILCNGNILSKEAIIICEAEKGENFSEEIGAFNIRKKYKYGKINIVIYERKENKYENCNLSG